MSPGRRAPAPCPRLSRTVGAALLAGAVLSPAAAQQAALPLLSFGISPRLESTFGDSAPLGVVGLDLSYVDATPVQTLSLAARGSLQGGGAGDSDTFTGPVLSFGYDRTSAGEKLALGATVRRDEVEDLADLSQFVDENGVIILPPDFDLLSGTGIRNQVSASAALSLRQNRPFSYGVSVAVDDLSYEDTTDPALVDSRRVTVGLNAGFALPGQRTITAGLRYSALDEDGSPLSETLGFDLAATANRPRGPITAGLSLDQTDDGIRSSARVGRTLTFPSGSVSGSLGVARSDTGDLSPTLNLSFQRTSPGGTVRLAATQALRAGSDDQDELASTVSAGFSRALTPRTSLSLSALLAATEPAGSDADPTRAADLGASVSYALSQAWALDSGIRGRIRDNGTDVTRSTTVFVGLSRRFQTTF